MEPLKSRTIEHVIQLARQVQHRILHVVDQGYIGDGLLDGVDKINHPGAAHQRPALANVLGMRTMYGEFLVAEFLKCSSEENLAAQQHLTRLVRLIRVGKVGTEYVLS